MPDFYEIQNGLNPLIDDSSLDPDNDGYSNLNEYEMGSDPHDPNDPGLLSSPNLLLIELIAVSTFSVVILACLVLKFRSDRASS